MRRDIYAEVTSKILTELEAGAAPWLKPWRSAGTAGSSPCNAVTNRPYSGVNVILLWIEQQERGYASPRYLTFKQAKAAGGTVRAGEKGNHVIFVKRLEVPSRKNPDELASIMMLKGYCVFNVAQCDGLPDHVVHGKGDRVKVAGNPGERDELADEFMIATGANIKEGAGEAYYRPASDFISLPAFEAFNGADSFYGTAFHELGHWTGHPSRLARDLKGRWDLQAYAMEELIAELCAAFLCAEFGMDGQLRHAGYLDHFVKLLKSDNRAIFAAASAASKAAEHLRGLALADDDEGETVAEAA